MILNANERGNAGELARHLMNERDNEHVELHELRGLSRTPAVTGAGSLLWTGAVRSIRSAG
jgi:hypothetical protein